MEVVHIFYLFFNTRSNYTFNLTEPKVRHNATQIECSKPYSRLRGVKSEAVVSEGAH